MIDISSWKLLLLAAIALIVVGPKDLPLLLRSIGKYIGIIKRQAAEFRAQFDEAIRESELSEIKKEFDSLGKETEKTLRDAEASVNAEIDGIKSEMDQVAADVNRPIERLEGGAIAASSDASSDLAAGSPAADLVPAVADSRSLVEGAALAIAVPADVDAGGGAAAPSAPAVAWPATRPVANPAAKTPERVEA